jgi:undecaprenyl diphosphate synthase
MAGVEAVKALVRNCPDAGIHTITLFAFAIANWKRDKEEVDGLWEILHTFFVSDLQELMSEGVRVIVIGDSKGLPDTVRTEAERVVKESENNTGLLLQIALNYDGVDEVARLIQKALINKVSPELVTSEFVRTNLDTQPGNEPDIIVRTGMERPRGEMSMWRSSAFLPIQGAQSVCVSSGVLWPDFTIEHLTEIIAYADPDSRLFGGQRKQDATSVVAA